MMWQISRRLGACLCVIYLISLTQSQSTGFVVILRNLTVQEGVETVSIVQVDVTIHVCTFVVTH
jgi:hypothetical protein